MDSPMYFSNKEEFRLWLSENYNLDKGINIYIYKKGYEDQGITYEEAVRTALCYGWIDSVTHSCDEKRFYQYFSQRLKRSNWSLSNKIRMRDLINENIMTENGLKYFDITCLDNLDDLIEAEKKAKKEAVNIPDFFEEILKSNNAFDLFLNQNKSTKRRYIAYIIDAKKEETKLRRCKKIVSIIKGETHNNL